MGDTDSISFTKVPLGDTIAPVFLDNNQNCIRGGSSNSRPRPKCEHCNRLKHTIECCWKLHGRPPCQVNATQIDHSNTLQISPSIQSYTPSYNDFIRWFQNNQNPGSTTSIAHIGNSFICLSQSSSLGPWVLDCGVSNHVIDNKGLSHSLSTSGFLPTITSVNGSQTQFEGIGNVQILPSLFATYVIYVPNFPSNLLPVSRFTHSLDCIIIFTNINYTLQDKSSRLKIGVRCVSGTLLPLCVI